MVKFVSFGSYSSYRLQRTEHLQFLWTTNRQRPQNSAIFDFLWVIRKRLLDLFRRNLRILHHRQQVVNNTSSFNRPIIQCLECLQPSKIVPAQFSGSSAWLLVSKIYRVVLLSPAWWDPVQQRRTPIPLMTTRGSVILNRQEVRRRNSEKPLFHIHHTRTCWPCLPYVLITSLQKIPSF